MLCACTSRILSISDILPTFMAPCHLLTDVSMINLQSSRGCGPSKILRKITSAMKMVAASKMRVAQSLTEKSRGLLTPFLKMLGDLPGVDSPDDLDTEISGLVHLS